MEQKRPMIYKLGENNYLVARPLADAVDKLCQFAWHDFWCQVAIAALFQVIDSCAIVEEIREREKSQRTS